MPLLLKNLVDFKSREQYSCSSDFVILIVEDVDSPVLEKSEIFTKMALQSWELTKLCVPASVEIMLESDKITLLLDRSNADP